MADETRFLKAVGASLSTDGQVSELQFVRADGSSADIQFPVAASAGFLFNVEHALGQVFEQQRTLLKGTDPRTFFQINTRRVAGIQGAVAQGVPIVSFTLQSNVRVDLALDRKQVRELAQWLLALEAGLDQPPPVRN
jgi:hypothetical protein